MLEPAIPGWKVEPSATTSPGCGSGRTVFNYASQPEFGFFGVAPGTNEKTNRAMRTIEKGNSVFANVALTGNGEHLVGGMENEPARHAWKEGEDWSPDSDELSSHPNSRYCTPIRQCPILADEYDDPQGADLGDLLGGRRKTTLVCESRDWVHRTFMGATLSSGTTAAATGEVGVVRRDPMAMLPFIGYNDYFSHWIEVGKDADADKLPRIFYVNWFRRDEDSGFLWPGSARNS